MIANNTPARTPGPGPLPLQPQGDSKSTVKFELKKERNGRNKQEKKTLHNNYSSLQWFGQRNKSNGHKMSDFLIYLSSEHHWNHLEDNHM